MNLLDLNNYEHMTPAECWERHGWGSEAIQGSTVLHLSIGRKEVFVDVVDDGYGGKHACELFDEHRGLEGQWFADTPQDAIRGAVVDSLGIQVMREEDNCEDAVNVIAGKAYEMLFGHSLEPTAECIAQIDTLLGFAREFVKANIRWVDYEWEEF